MFTTMFNIGEMLDGYATLERRADRRATSCRAMTRW